MIRLLLIFSYIFFCLRLRVTPRKYFQLNAPYFNERRGIFSKLDIDRLIPDNWQLKQFLDIGNKYPSHYPVFVKPEWGQNSHGIHRADSAGELDNIRLNRDDTKLNHLIQEAAPGNREFEIFIIHSNKSADQPDIISITETTNSSDDPFPINGIYNKTTHYKDITSQLSLEQQQLLWQHLKQISPFHIARYCLRASAIETMLKGEFHIVEINLFLPMPLTLITDNTHWKEKIKFCLQCMRHLAQATKAIPASQPHKSVFFKKLKLSHTLKLANKMRSYNERT